MRKFLAGFALGGTVVLGMLVCRERQAPEQAEDGGPSRVQVEVERATLRVCVTEGTAAARMREKLKRAATSLLGPHYRVRSHAEVFQGGRMQIILRAEVEKEEKEERLPSQPQNGTVSEQIVEARFP